MQDLARSYLELWQDHLKAVAHDADISETLTRTTALMSITVSRAIPKIHSITNPES